MELLETLQERLRRETDCRLKERLHVLFVTQAGEAQTQVEAAEALAVHPKPVWRWLQTHRDG